MGQTRDGNAESLPAAAQWQKSRRSGAQGNCVEICRLEYGVAVRDSKDPAGPVLIFSSARFAELVSSLKKDHFPRKV